MNFNKLFVTAVLFVALLSSPAKAQITSKDFSFGYRSRPTTTRYTHYYDSDQSLFSIVVGYVNKSWRCTYPNGISQREDFFGDPDDKFLHGVQIGGLFTPSFDWGLGLRTGLFFEGYTSRSKWVTPFCHHFSEGDLYIPAHASYRILFSDECDLNLFGGMGFQWAMDGGYYRRIGTAWPYYWRRPRPIYEGRKHEYGNGFPQRVNWQAECGLSLRIREFMIGFTYSFGIVDHGIENTFDDGETFITSTKSRQDKMQATIGFIF